MEVCALSASKRLSCAHTEVRARERVGRGLSRWWWFEDSKRPEGREANKWLELVAL